jgi:hypothetical protein
MMTTVPTIIVVPAPTSLAKARPKVSASMLTTPPIVPLQILVLLLVATQALDVFTPQQRDHQIFQQTPSVLSTIVLVDRDGKLKTTLWLLVEQQLTSVSSTIAIQPLSLVKFSMPLPSNTEPL